MSALRRLALHWRQRRWRNLAEQCREPRLAGFYREMHYRFSATLAQTTFLAVDLEMTGLNPARDRIVSIGFVPIVAGAVRLDQAQYFLIRGEQDMGDSATIHHIRDQDLHQAETLDGALTELLQALPGRVLVLHHAPLDLAFLTRAFAQVFNGPFEVPVVDTLRLERQRLLARGHPVKDGDLRLFNCRRRYGLPDLSSHNALTDALATAELFLAIAAHKGELEKLVLGEFISL